jgi:hypothetical protein
MAYIVPASGYVVVQMLPSLFLFDSPLTKASLILMMEIV